MDYIKKNKLFLNFGSGFQTPYFSAAIFDNDLTQKILHENTLKCNIFSQLAWLVNYRHPNVEP